MPLSEHRKQYLESNREKIKAQQKIRSARWYEKNKEHALALGKALYASDKERINARNKQYYLNNREKINKQIAEYRRTHSNQKKALDKEWRIRNKDKKAAKDKEYRIKNADHVRDVQRAWKQKNKDRVRVSLLKRKALKKKAAVNLAGMKEWMRLIYSKPFAKCYYCEKRISTRSIHIDHIVPLIEGGMHAVENLCVSCPECNLSKSRKPITIWVKPGQQVLAL